MAGRHVRLHVNHGRFSSIAQWLSRLRVWPKRPVRSTVTHAAAPIQSLAIVAALALLSVGSPVSARTQDGADTGARSVTPGTLAEAPTIDGILDDQEWLGAARVPLRFQIEPGDNVSASEPTEVFLAMDTERLFVAFAARDSDPVAIRARVVKRDELAQEDFVAIYLDTYNDRQRAYRFSFNPLGIQEDGIFTDGSAFDASWDGVVESAGTVTPDGYVVEVAIPFSTLRFRAGPSTVWGLHLQRRIARRAETISWVPRSRDVFGILQQAGVLTGLDAVTDRPTVDLIPTLTTAIESDRESDPVGGTTDTVRRPLALGMTALYAITPSLTLSGTINPDFSQIESDVPQISVNQRFALFYPERRPFFFEGTEIFSALSEDLIRLLNTRRIVDPDWGAKLTGKVGRYAIGVLSASDRTRAGWAQDAGAPQANTLFTVGRVRRDLGTDSSVGVWAIDQRAGRAASRVLATDGRFRLSDASQVFVNLVTSRIHTSEGTRTAGHATDLRFNHVARNWRVYVGDRYVSPQFSNPAGFLERENYHEQTADIGYEWRPRAGSALSRWLVYAWPYLDVSHARYASDGTPEVQYVDPAVKIVFQRGASLLCYPSFHREGYAEQIARFRFGACDHSVEAFKHVAFSGSMRFGDGLNYDPDNVLVGSQTDTMEEVTIRPMNTLSIGLLYLRSVLTDRISGERLVNQQVVRNRTTWAWTRFQAARAIFEYDTSVREFSASVVYAWTPRPNTAFYLGWNDQRFTEYDPDSNDAAPGWARHRRTLFVKLSVNVRSSTPASIQTEQNQRRGGINRRLRMRTGSHRFGYPERVQGWP